MYEDMIAIQSEYIYESIMIESSNKLNIVDKIKKIWNMLVNFITRIKNNILKLIRGNKNKINVCDKEISYKDYSVTVAMCRQLISDLKENNPDFNKSNPRVSAFKKYEESIITDKAPIAIKNLEKWAVEIDGIVIQLNRIVQKKVAELSKQDTDVRILDNLREIPDKIKKIIDEINNHITLCIKQANEDIAMYNNLPEYVTKSDVESIYLSLDDARSILIVRIPEYYTHDCFIYLLDLALKHYGDKLYEPDKHVTDEEEYIYGFNIDNITDKRTFSSHTVNIRFILYENFSKKKVEYLKGKALAIHNKLY